VGKTKPTPTTDPVDSGTGTTTGGTTGTTTGTTTPTEPTLTPTNNYVSGLDTIGGFNIELVFAGTGWTDALKQGFHQAAEFLSDIITGDLPNMTTSTGVVDDMRISVSLVTIDGSGGIIGKGGYTALRTDTKLPYDGYVRMDSADAVRIYDKGTWDDFAIHEMLHSLGFGTAWKTMGLITDLSGDLRFNGDMATKVYNELYAAKAATDPYADIGIPVETDGGTGTAGMHWDETTFGSETMTGWLGTTNTLSDMSIAALEDMGYNTIMSDHLFV
jgi:hypothetical protein